MKVTGNVVLAVAVLCFGSADRIHADVAWDTVQQITQLPFVSSGRLGYNNAHNIGVSGDTVYIVFPRYDNELHILRSYDAGETWEVPVTTGITDINNPSIAVSDSGVIHCNAIATDRKSLIYVRSIDGGTTWDFDTVWNFPGMWYHVDESADIDVDYEGNVHIIYTITDNGTVTEMNYLRSTDSGATWAGPTVLIPVTAHHGGVWIGSLASDLAGRLHIVCDVWWDLGSWVPKQSYLSSPDLGVTWDTLEHIVTHTATGRYGLDTYGKDTVAFCWSFYPSFEIWMRPSPDAGDSWMSSIQISDNAGGGDHWSCLEFDTSGGMHIVWGDPGLWGIAYRYVGPDFVPADTIARLSTLPGYYGIPDVYCDKKGRVHVAWTQQPLDTTAYEVFYRRGTVYTDVEENTEASERHAVLTLYPTVFSRTVSIRTHADATVAIYDVAGKRIRSFTVESGCVAQWDATDGAGTRLPAGVYIVEATTDKTSRTQKIVHVE